MRRDSNQPGEVQVNLVPEGAAGQNAAERKKTHHNLISSLEKMGWTYEGYFTEEDEEYIGFSTDEIMTEEQPLELPAINHKHSITETEFGYYLKVILEGVSEA